MNPWYDLKFMERLTSVPEKNRLILTFRHIQPTCVAETRLHIVILVATDQYEHEHTICLREEVVFMLHAASVSLSRIVPHPRSMVYRLSATWGVGCETEEEAAEAREKLKQEGHVISDPASLDAALGGTELHNPVFSEVEAVLIEGNTPDEATVLTTMFAKRNGEPYAYSFGLSTVKAIVYAMLNREAISTGEETDGPD